MKQLKTEIIKSFNESIVNAINHNDNLVIVVNKKELISPIVISLSINFKIKKVGANKFIFNDEKTINFFFNKLQISENILFSTFKGKSLHFISVM